jgi:hypothetical protein
MHDEMSKKKINFIKEALIDHKKNKDVLFLNNSTFAQV